MNAESIHLEHALLDVRDMTRSLSFYQRLIPGWTIRWEGRTSEDNRWAHFGPPGEGQPGYLSLYELPGGSPPDNGLEGSLRIEHIGFAHPDVEALVARLAAEGIRPGDRADDGKYRRAYFTDPDGHELEFVQKL